MPTSRRATHWIPLVAGTALLCLSESTSATEDRTLGVVGGELRACPSSPNCVSSQAGEAAHRIEPLRIDVDAEASMQKLADVIRAMPRAEVLTLGNGYLRAEFTSRIFGWVDDVEAFAVPSEGVIHLRSASRVGYWDLGANRRRIGELRERYTTPAE